MHREKDADVGAGRQAVVSEDQRGEFCECSARGQEMSWCEERGRSGIGLEFPCQPVTGRD